MCNDFLSPKTIQLQKTASDRNEAIHLAAEPLIESGKVTAGYVTQMIDAVDQMGPYMVLMPGIALAHGRPSENVKADCMSLLTLKTPVVFGHEKHDPVSIIFVLAAHEAGSHLCILKDISKLLVDDEFVETLRTTDDMDVVMRYFDHT